MGLFSVIKPLSNYPHRFIYCTPYFIACLSFQKLMATLKAPDQESKTTVMAINLILQFLYFELRHSNKVVKWVHRKLSLELDELISKTTIGKLFDKLSVSLLSSLFLFSSYAVFDIIVQMKRCPLGIFKLN